MALARCSCCGVLQSRTRRYSGQAVRPVGYPHSALLCGRVDCFKPGLLWLEEGEWSDYQHGKRIFFIPGPKGVKIRVE